MEFVFGKLFLTNLATASFAVFSFLTIPNILNFSDSGNSGLDDLLSSYDSDSFVEFEIRKIRGLEEAEVKEKLESFIDEMVDSKKLNASIKYGSENFIITITGVSLSNEDLNCFEVNIYSTNNNKALFCKSDEETSLLYIN